MKHTKKLITLAVASVMALGCVSLASCGGDDNTGGNNGGSSGGNNGGTTVSGDGIVKDTSLQGKLFAAYTFDNESGAATDPFTGASLSAYDWTTTEDQEYTAEQKRTGKAAVSGQGFTMPWYKDLFNASEDSFSFSYWTWSDTSNSDWNLLLSGEYQSITYGNLSGETGAYPGQNSTDTVGRGAYSDSSYAEAQDVYSTAQLASFNGGQYAGYNAALYETGDSAKPGSVGVAEEMCGTAQYMTVVVTTGESIKFYRNGALSYCYLSVDGSDYFNTDVYDGDEGFDKKIVAFGGACGYVDDVIVGSGLTDEEVLALYNDQMGDTKTMDDVTLKSNLNEDDATRNEAKEAATAEAVAAYKEAAAAKVTEAAATTGIKVFGDTSFGNAWNTEFLDITPDSADSFDVTLTGVLIADGVNNWDSLLTIVASSAGQEYILRQDNFGWSGAVSDAAYTQNGATYNWDTFLVDINGGTVSVNFKYDGTKVDVLYTVKPLLAGQTFTASKDITLADGTTETVTAEFTVPTEYTCSYTVTGLGGTGIFPSFSVEASYLIVTEVVGGKIK